MPEITGVEAQKHDPERLNIYVDGQFAFGISAMVAMARGLSCGQQLDEAGIAELRIDDSVERAYSSALNFLSYRPRSRGEIRAYFRRKKQEESVTEAVIARLERARLLDDLEFGRYWAENRQTFRPRGSRALRAEMRQKGLASDVIDEVISSIGDEEEAARAAGFKKLRSFERLDQPEFVQKMTAFLQRRGFPYELSARVSRELALARVESDSS